MQNLEEISVENKIKAFDNLYKQALDYYNDVLQNGYGDNDNRHYLFEAVMLQTLGKNVFKEMNKADQER